LYRPTVIIRECVSFSVSTKFVEVNIYNFSGKIAPRENKIAQRAKSKKNDVA